MADEVWRPRRHHRRETYYKVQVFEQRSQSWRDVRGVFDTVEAARGAVAERKEMARIMVIEGGARYPLPD